MKRNKVIFRMFLAFLLVFCIDKHTIAATRKDVVVRLQIDNPIMQVNGILSEIDGGNNTAPIVRGGRTLVPTRAIIEAFGGTVDWDNATKTVTLTLEEDFIKLTIDNPVACFNNNVTILDVSPTVINGRTMLPIRFIAESFNLGVGWQNDTRTVYIITNGFDEEEYQIVKNLVPEYSGSPYTEVNGNKPFFKEHEIIEASFEFYADLDELGRCDVAMASVGTDIMPTEERGSISSVTPTGWINAKYTNVEGGYLYNRCHLIGFQLTGETANERNLITGTRRLNIQGMLPFENMIDDYVERTNNNVVYRSTPVFSENNLVADGVLLEAYSVEDNGQGISFCVYCYNVQPGITIDYKTGASRTFGEELNSPSVNESVINNMKTDVYRTPSGKRYHFDAECGGKNSYNINLQDAVNAGLTPCKKCAQ